MNFVSYLLAIAAGAANPAQSGSNSQLQKLLQNPLWVGVWVYVSGLLGVLVLIAITRKGWPGSEQLAQVPWWAWIGGLLSIASTLSGLAYAQKMGSGVFTGLSVTASLITSLALDHFGLLGFKVHPATPMRIAGSALMVVGLWLVAKF